MFFVSQKKRKTNGTWDNGIINKPTRNEALHQFHAFMSTYGYEQDATIDYVSCEVKDIDGVVHMREEIDNRIPEE